MTAVICTNSSSLMMRMADSMADSPGTSSMACCHQPNNNNNSLKYNNNNSKGGLHHQKLQHQNNSSNQSSNSGALMSIPKHQILSAKQVSDRLCNEQHDSVYPLVEPRVIKDDRLLSNLLQAELVYLPVNYCETTQTEIRPEMRRIVTEWMFDVCQEERADCEVFPLAVNLMDRFLGVETIFKDQLQCLATTALFIASKVKCATPFKSDRLCGYSDNSIVVGDLLSWELLAMKALNWEVCVPTQFDFIEHLLSRFSMQPQFVNQLRQQCQNVVPMACRVSDYSLTAVFPTSMLACMSLYVSARNLCHQVPYLSECVLDNVNRWLGYDKDLLRSMAESSLLMPPNILSSPTCGNTAKSFDMSYEGAACRSPSGTLTDEQYVQAQHQQAMCSTPTSQWPMYTRTHVVTPTDVQDVFAMAAYCS